MLQLKALLGLSGTCLIEGRTLLGFAHHVFTEATALPTICGHTQILTQVFIIGTVIYGLLYLAVGYTFANAYIHGGTLITVKATFL